MSRSGRATEYLDQWRDHPRGCTATHGSTDGYDGPCTDEAWDVVQMLGHIDPWFHTYYAAEALRLLDLGADLNVVRDKLRHVTGEADG